MQIPDEQINEKYVSNKNNILIEIDRIKLPQLVENINNDPNYMIVDQNHQFNWDNSKQSRLIESFLLNIPVIPIVVWEIHYKSYRVIDGKERIKTIVDFYSNNLTLNDLDILKNLNGCNYTNFPQKKQEKLNRQFLTFNNIMFDSDADPDEVEKLIQITSQRLGN